MHELSVATALAAQAQQAAVEGAVGRVVTVNLRLGALSALVPESLEYGFGIAVAGTPLEGARLEIERVPAVIWCPTCEAAVTLATTTRFRCPTCDTPSAEVLAGRELELVSLEIDDVPVGSTS